MLQIALKVSFGFVSVSMMQNLSIYLGSQMCWHWFEVGGCCHFGRREEDQLFIDCQQQSSLCESWCRQRRDRGHVNRFHISLAFTKSLLVFPLKKTPSLPLPKSIILPPALPFPSPQSTSSLLFSYKEWEAFDLFSLSASTRRCLSASSQCQLFPTSFVLLDSFLALF